MFRRALAFVVVVVFPACSSSSATYGEDAASDAGRVAAPDAAVPDADAPGFAEDATRADGSGAIDPPAASDAKMPPPDAAEPRAPESLTERWNAHCDAQVAECGHERAECEARRDCYTQWFRAEIATVYLDCAVEQGCQVDDDACGARAVGSATPSERSTALDESCRERRDACGGSFPGTGDTGSCHVLYGSVLTDAQLDAYSACLSEPCDQVGPCIRGAEPAACRGP